MMLLFSYIAALWCAGYSIFVGMQIRYNNLGFFGGLADFFIGGVMTSIAAWWVFRFILALCNLMEGW